MDSPAPRPPEALPYHRALRTYLSGREPKVWEWFASDQARTDHADAVRLELLKSTYRLERPAHAPLYALADEAAARLGIAAPITLYQAQAREGLNAFLAHLPGEIHLVLVGPVAGTLAADEQRALFGHEIAHFALLEAEGGAYLVAERILDAMANDPRAEPSHERTARLWRLYTEIFADRGALLAAGGDLLAAVAVLVKVTTGLRDASAEGYLRQADEIFSREAAQAREETHPETFIRARALRLFQERGDDSLADVRAMIEGPLGLDALDLLAQQRLTAATRALLDRLLAREWLRTDAVMAHARTFFADWMRGGPGDGAEEFRAEGLRDYLCALLLDFVALTPELEEAPLAAAYALASSFDAGPALLAAAERDLGVARKRIEKVRKESARILEEAGRK